MHNRPPLPAIIIIILLIASAGVYFTFFANRQPVSTVLTASGTVETTSVSIAPELSGKVVEVSVSEGDAVKAGDVLFKLDNTIMQAQREVSEASLESSKAAAVTADAAVATAQAQYDMAVFTALNEDRTNRTASWSRAKPTDFDKPAWYFDKSEELTAALAEETAAQTALASALENLKFVQEKANSSEFMAVESRLITARIAFQTAQDVLTRANSAADGKELKNEAQNIFDAAKSDLIDAQKAYNDSITSSGSDDVLQARAKLFVAQERAYIAADRIRSLKTGLQSLKVVAAQKALEQAIAAASQSKHAVNQAEANIRLIDAQIGKLTVTAPTDGVILLRNVQSGEVVNPGSIVLTLGRLADLTITVYIPEDRYGEISLGQAVDVKIDSFPNVIFIASVIEISNKAEFTPRNVQTAEGRKSTVFAIKLRVEDPKSQLKPGMPADVTFK